MYRSLGGDMVFPPCRSGSNCDVIRKGIYLYHHGGRFFLNFQSLIRNGGRPAVGGGVHLTGGCEVQSSSCNHVTEWDCTL
jgi:hypothetical protein